jgi:hypothetical protein
VVVAGARIPASLDDVKATLGATLHCPDNLGIIFRPLRLRHNPQTRLMALFITGLADEELIRLWAIEPLERIPTLPAAPRAHELMELISAPRTQVVRRTDAVIEAVLRGETALFIDGSDEAVLVSTQARGIKGAGSTVPEEPHKEIFRGDLMADITLIRKRLRDPGLIAEPVKLQRDRGAVALVYMTDRVDKDVLTQVRQWVKQRMGEEAMRRGLAAGLNGKIGLLPETLSSKWPDRAAGLLDVGHIAIVVDGLQLVNIAPVTSPALLYAPFDATVARPISHLLRLIRLVLAFVVLISSGLLIALMNYHQEMMPTPFLLALASGRENAPFPILLEILYLELTQEVVREAGFHLPGRLAPGASLIGGKVLVLILVIGGVVGALQAAVSIGMAFIMLGLLNYELIYVLRIWRFVMLLGAAIFGFFGMAAVGFLMAAYLTQATSFGLPFWGESGLRFTAPGAVASRKGGKVRAAKASVW